MGRWKPDARGRLEKAALELYATHGFAQTTVADIANRAGLAERTFFRHFADKREVLFGDGTLNAILEKGIAAAPEAASAMDAIGVALDTVATLLQERYEFAKQRRAVIAANAELQERELVKLASMASGIAVALRRRGVREPSATLAAEAGIAVFKVAYDRWVTEKDEEEFARFIRESLEDLKVTVSKAGP